MIADGAEEVPASAAAIPELALVRNLPTLAPCAACQSENVVWVDRRIGLAMWQLDGEPVEEQGSDDDADEAEAEQEDHAKQDEEPPADEPAAAQAEPKTKGELLMQLKIQHKNTMRLVAALLHDRDLRVELKQIQLGSGPLHAELPDSSVLEAQEWFRDEQKNLNELWFYLLEVVSKRAWGQVQHATLFPQLLASALSDDKRAAAASMSAAERTWDAILRAEEIQHHGAGSISAASRVSLGRIMNDMAFNRQSFARECAVVCQQARWQHDYKDVQDLARSLYAKPLNTKFDLEDCFAHLSSVQQLTSKATPFNKCFCCID
eukprot:s7544_g2.t1